MTDKNTIADVLSALKCICDDLPDAKTKQQKAMWAADAEVAMLNAFQLINEQFVENERLQKLISWQGEGNNKAVVNAGPLMKHMDERDQLKAECETLRKSACRYEWLRAKHNDRSEFLAVCGEDDVILEHLMGVDGLDLDAAIDSAMLREEIPDFTPGNGNKARRRAADAGIDYDAAMGQRAKS